MNPTSAGSAHALPAPPPLYSSLGQHAPAPAAQHHTDSHASADQSIPLQQSLDVMQSRLSQHMQELNRIISSTRVLPDHTHSTRPPSASSAATLPPRVVPHPARTTVAQSVSRTHTPHVPGRSKLTPAADHALSKKLLDLEHDSDPVADCHPWTGAHNEDKLSDTVIKVGYTERAKVVNELTTARPTLWPHLKHGTGLQALSSIFAATLQQRREFGRVSSQSTFKPPPRVTLTDSKREAWLKDLADEHVPLRRLSRTIPHGIRGKTLLDQCQAKAIPFPRAVWLVKCVGANELRAFRRKGVSPMTAAGNESKWIKEWTSLIECFIEGSIAKTPTDGARARLNYAIRLTVRLYTEKLLDATHFLDWLLSFLEQCALEKVPIAVLLIQSLWKDITASFSTAQRVGKACCSRLQQLPLLPDADALKPLAVRLHSMYKSLLLQHSRSCVYASQSWPMCKGYIRNMLKEGADSTQREVLINIVERNDRLYKIAPQSAPSVRSGALAVVAILDHIDYSRPIHLVVYECLALLGRPDALVTLLMRWSTSTTRAGSSSYALAAACIRHIAAKQPNVSTVVSDAVIAMRSYPQTDPQKLSQLLGLLAIHGVFDSASYLRWCMTCGVMNGVTLESLESDPCARFVRDMPFKTLSPNAANMRKMLLQPLNCLGPEDAMLMDLKRHAAQYLYVCLGLAAGNQRLTQLDTLHMQDFFSKLAGFNNGVRCALATWAVARVIDYFSKLEARHDLIVPTGEFIFLRTLIESHMDTVLLSQIIRTCLSHCDLDLFSHIIDTIFRHQKFLRVDGQFNSLVAMTIEKYRHLRIQNPPAGDAVFSLTKLATGDPRLGQLQRYLEQEREICNQTLSAVAYTPASESMADSQDLAGSIDAEVDRLLSSGAGIDMTAVQQVFKLLQTYGQKDLKHVVAFVSSNGPLLARLRDANIPQFEELLANWLNGPLLQCDDSSLSTLTVSLIGSGCMNLGQLLEAFKRVVECGKLDAASTMTTLKRMVGTLNRGTLETPVWLQKEAYRYQSDVDNFIAMHSVELAIMLVNFVVRPDISCDEWLPRDFMSSVFQLALAKDSKTTVLLLLNNRTEPMMEHLLNSSLQSLSLGSSPLHRLESIFYSVDSVSLTICELAMAMTYNGSDEEKDTVEKAAQKAIEAGRECWPELLAAVDSSIAIKIREQAEDAFLAHHPDRQTLQLGQDWDFAAVKKCLGVVLATAHTIQGDKLGPPQTSICSKITQGLALIARKLATCRSDEQAQALDEPAQQWIDSLIQFAVMHHAAFIAPASVGDLQRLLSFLSIIALAGAGAVSMNIRRFAYDACAHFLSDLSPASISQLRQHIGSPPAGSIAGYLFGPQPSDNSWLQLVTFSAKTNAAPSSSHSTPQPTPQLQPTQTSTFTLRPFELLPDSTPNVGDNDTALSLKLFGARQVTKLARQ